MLMKSFRRISEVMYRELLLQLGIIEGSVSAIIKELWCSKFFYTG